MYEFSAFRDVLLFCVAMWCDVMWCDVMWCDVMWCSSVNNYTSLINGWLWRRERRILLLHHNHDLLSTLNTVRRMCRAMNNDTRWIFIREDTIQIMKKRRESEGEEKYVEREGKGREGKGGTTRLINTGFRRLYFAAALINMAIQSFILSPALDSRRALFQWVLFSRFFVWFSLLSSSSSVSGLGLLLRRGGGGGGGGRRHNGVLFHHLTIIKWRHRPHTSGWRKTKDRWRTKQNKKKTIRPPPKKKPTPPDRQTDRRKKKEDPALLLLLKKKNA